METSKPRKAIYIVDDPDSIRLLADFIRTEILHLLSKYPMTATQLAEQLGLTRAAVGYHLRLLMKARLITINKIEAEKHGILQKYYTPRGVLLIVDPAHIPKGVERYFIRTQIEHLRGIFSALQLYHHVSKVSSKTLEELAVAMLKQLKIIGQKHKKDMAPEDTESLRIKIYAEAFANLIKQKEWRNLYKLCLRNISS
jgi:DNA-binding transcriptional ArsR family regulator